MIHGYSMTPVILSFLLTLRGLESMACSRSRLRLCFSAWVREGEFGEEEDEGFAWSLEQSLTAPLPGRLKLRTRPALIILHSTVHK